MTQSSKTRIGIILDDPQSTFLNDLFKESELGGRTQVIRLSLRRIRRSFFFKVLRSYFQHVRLNTSALSVTHAEHVALLFIARIQRLHHLVALDNKLELLSAVAVTLRRYGTRCFAIQMGTNPKYYSTTSKNDVRVAPITMFCWGSREPDSYIRSGLRPEQFVETGSLKRYVARHRNGNSTEKRWDLCLVSQFRPFPSTAQQVSPSSRFEAESMPNLIKLLRPIIIRNKLRTVVAVKAGRRLYDASIENQEVDFYRSALGDIVEIGLSANPYASYGLAEASKLVIGRNSGLLTEMLDSKSRVLFVNPTDFSLFDAPVDWPFRLSKPSELELEALILALLGTTWIDYSQKVGLVARRHCAQAEHGLKIFADSLAIKRK